MKILSVKMLAVILVFLLVLVAVLAGTLFLNITFDYPLNDVRIKVIEYKELNGKFPELLSELTDVVGVKFMSVLEYENRGDDFLLYFCPTKLGPCEVCSKSREPYFDEI